MLHDGWTITPILDAAIPSDVPAEVLDGVGEPIPAGVPGAVHLALLDAGLITDPFLDANELSSAWVSRLPWVYAMTFELSPAAAARLAGRRIDLACAGLDTVATISLNDIELGRTANMHRSFRFAVDDVLRPGANTLRITLDSPYSYAERLRDVLGPRPNEYPQPFNFIRKTASSFGWDWGPTVPGAGIWQDLALHTWDAVRLASVRPLVRVDGTTGRVEVHVEIERAAGVPADDAIVRARIGTATAEATIAPGDDSAVLHVVVDEPELWWPRGYGEQPLYDLAVELTSDASRAGDGRLHDSWQRRIGFRTVALDTTPDEHGSAFTITVNGVPVFVRGVNWIPDDAFPTRVTRERLAQRLTQACEANVNLVRVWGGGRYESEDFYELADTLGLLVMQDFLFACAAYPEEEPIGSEVAAEAHEHVTRLAAHPSLVLWNGNNENLWGHADWDWVDPLDGRTWGEGFYHDLLPRIVAELDPTRPYWPGSPYSGNRELHPNDPRHGTTHIWDVWNTDDYTRYRDYHPRFVAEFGYQAPSTYATLRRSISDEVLAPDSPGMRHHQKADDGQAKLQRGLDAHLPVPRDFDDWHYLTQVNQARAMTIGVEHFRASAPVCMGTIVWQLNDCWPVTSWSAVDGDGRRKPLWYALRDAYADRLLTIQPENEPENQPGDAPDGLAVVAVNDTAAPWTAQVEVARLTMDGMPQAKTVLDVEVPPRGTLRVPLPAEIWTPADSAAELVVATAGDHRTVWFFERDRHLDYPEADYHATVSRIPTGVEVTVTARTLLRDLVVQADRLDPGAEVDRSLVTLLPGESAVFTVRSSAELDVEALTSRPVLRCVNDVRRTAPPHV